MFTEAQTPVPEQEQTPVEICEKIGVVSSAYSSRLVLAQVMKEAGYEINVSETGKSLAGEDLPDSLENVVEIEFVGRRTLEVYGAVTGKERFRTLDDAIRPSSNWEGRVNKDEWGRYALGLKILGLDIMARYYNGRVESISQTIFERPGNGHLAKIRSGYEADFSAIKRRLQELTQEGAVITPEEFREVVRAEVVQAEAEIPSISIE